MKPVELARLFAGPDGVSRFEAVQWTLDTRAFAPPSAPLHITGVHAACDYALLELPSGWDGDVSHASPAPYLVVCLAGSFEITAGSGETRSFTAGDMLLLDDVVGSGHKTIVLSEEPVRTIMIRRPNFNPSLG